MQVTAIIPLNGASSEKTEVYAHYNDRDGLMKALEHYTYAVTL